MNCDTQPYFMWIFVTKNNGVFHFAVLLIILQLNAPARYCVVILNYTYETKAPLYFHLFTCFNICRTSNQLLIGYIEDTQSNCCTRWILYKYFTALTEHYSGFIYNKVSTFQYYSKFMAIKITYKIVIYLG